MSAKLTRAALLAKAKEHGVSRAMLMDKLGVSKQRFTNWDARGVPPSMHQRAADAIRCSVDELLGRAAPVKNGPSTTHGYPISPEAAEFGWEWEKLPPALRELTQLQISLLVAAYRRGEIPDRFTDGPKTEQPTKAGRDKRGPVERRPPRPT